MEDECRRAQIRALVSAGSIVFVVVGGNAVVVAWGRPARTVAVAAALTGLVVLVYLHLIRFSSSRPIRWGSFQGLSWADCYRVTDTIARGEAVAEPHLARPALGYARQLETASRSGLVLVPLFLGSMVVRHLTGDLSGRRLASDLLTGAIVVAGTIRWRLRMPRFREAQARTRALHHLE